MAATLSTDAQILLAIGANASSDQTNSTNTDIWGLQAESEMENAFGGKIGLVANYGNITAALKQWLAVVHSDRTAWKAINQNQNSWGLATAQSKLNVLSATWKGFLSDIKNKGPEIVADLGLTYAT